jgi:hypothetical protein
VAGGVPILQIPTIIQADPDTQQMDRRALRKRVLAGATHNRPIFPCLVSGIGFSGLLVE